MIIIMKPQATEEQIGSLCHDLSRKGMQVQRNAGVDCTVLGVLGDVARLDPHDFLIQPGVERVMPVSEPFKKANRKFHPDNTVITLPGGQTIGGGELTIIAGPCSVESRDQIVEIAKRVKAAGATFLRGGAFKPRTSPYAFQGLRAEGLELLLEADGAALDHVVDESAHRADVGVGFARFDRHGKVQSAVFFRDLDERKNVHRDFTHGALDRDRVVRKGVGNTLDDLNRDLGNTTHFTLLQA